MKLKILLALGLLLFQTAVDAAPAKEKKAKPTPTRNGAQLGTSFRFDGSSMYGKVQNPFGTSAVVENDKYLEDLLGARKNFDDREKKEEAHQ